MDVITTIEEAEEWIGDIEDKIIENKEAKKKRQGKLLDHEYRLRKLSDIIRNHNIQIIGVPEEKWEKGAEGLFEHIIDENICNLQKKTGVQVQEAQKPPQNQQKQVNTNIS